MSYDTWYKETQIDGKKKCCVVHLGDGETLDDGLEHKTDTNDDVKNNSSPMANKGR
jgi:hypothetical protein